MDTQAVNWGALDALVLDYLDQEQLLEDSEDNRSFDLNINGPREIISLIRSLIESGYITESLNLLQQHAHVVLEDQRLLFRLYKQVYTIFFLFYFQLVYLFMDHGRGRREHNEQCYGSEMSPFGRQI